MTNRDNDSVTKTTLSDEDNEDVMKMTLPDEGDVKPKYALILIKYHVR